MTKITVPMEDWMHKALLEISKTEDRSVAATIRIACRERLKKSNQSRVTRAPRKEDRA